MIKTLVLFCLLFNLNLNAQNDTSVCDCSKYSYWGIDSVDDLSFKFMAEYFNTEYGSEKEMFFMKGAIQFFLNSWNRKRRCIYRELNIELTEQEKRAELDRIKRKFMQILNLLEYPKRVEK